MAAQNGGPRLPRSGQSYRYTELPAGLDVAPADTIRVRPNHWKRGATIGILATTVPLTVWMISKGCGNSGTGKCIAAGSGMLSVTGLIGWMTGGLIGSFFKKDTEVGHANRRSQDEVAPLAGACLGLPDCMTLPPRPN